MKFGPGTLGVQVQKLDKYMVKDSKNHYNLLSLMKPYIENYWTSYTIGCI